MNRLFVIGLDCADPTLVFDRWAEELPHLRQLMAAGTYGELESTTPPITVPAWSCMLTGRDPGELGFYGFRNRADYSYDQMSIANSAAVKHPRVWGRASASGKQVVVVNVPQTYPPRPLNGSLVTSFLTPSTFSEYTYPTSLKAEIAQTVGDYVIDVRDFRTEDKDYLLQQIYDMTEKRCRLVKHFLRTKPWDFFMWVEMGVDRIHHAFWKFMDPAHPKHEPGNRYQDAILDYYRYLDGQIGEMLDLVPDDAAELDAQVQVPLLEAAGPEVAAPLALPPLPGTPVLGTATPARPAEGGARPAVDAARTHGVGYPPHGTGMDAIRYIRDVTRGGRHRPFDIRGTRLVVPCPE